MFLVAPTYFRPMFGSALGVIMLATLIAIVVIGYGLVEIGIAVLRKGRLALGVVVLIGVFVTWLVAICIVLLGPAALILTTPAT